MFHKCFKTVLMFHKCFNEMFNRCLTNITNTLQSFLIANVSQMSQKCLNDRRCFTNVSLEFHKFSNEQKCFTMFHETFNDHKCFTNVLIIKFACTYI